MRSHRAIALCLKCLRQGTPWLALVLAASACARTPPDTTAARQPSEAALAQGMDGFTLAEEAEIPEEVRSVYGTSVGLMKQERYELAISRLLKVIEQAPELTAPHINLGIAYVKVDDPVRAEASLRRALELNPRHPAALNELGMLQRRGGKFEESRASYEAALTEFADFHFAHRNLGILCELYLGDMECALEHYRAYSRLVPYDSEVAEWMAALSGHEGREGGQ